MQPDESRPERDPNIPSIISFWTRSKALQIVRAAKNIHGNSPELAEGAQADFPFVLAESVSPLRTTMDSREKTLVLGKIHNLRLASRKIHHRVLQPGQIFSFWRQVGPPWKFRGFETGREVREGCVIPTRGGGICQLSGSLLEVALSLRFELIEKHGHTALPADVPRNPQRDATVFWNYVDLRFRAPFLVMLESYLTDESLVVRVRSQTPRTAGQVLQILPIDQAGTRDPVKMQNCFVCGKISCVRHRENWATSTASANTRSAFLMDEYQPEFNTYILESKTTQDLLLSPFRSGQPGKDWSHEQFDQAHCFPLFRYQRAWALRRSVAQGVNLAQTHFALAETLAKRYGKRIPYDVEHVCVAQTLLPHLWRSGVLGGRIFDVLMYRFPAAILEREVEHALVLYPESRTLREFRAPRWFREAEGEALQAARRILTPHSQIAKLFQNPLLLPWDRQVQRPQNKQAAASRDLIVFFGPTLAREGAHAVRDAVKKLGFPLVVVGSDLEEQGFWDGLPVMKVGLQNLEWERVYLVLQPALFEYWPRHLLRAHAGGSRVVISANCGIPEDRDSGIYHVPFGDADALVSTVEAVLKSQIPPLASPIGWSPVGSTETAS